ncbi:MAG: hypothetical protein A2428_07225 [Bdellovibrionales bacterium RIFOXYC1_FULL_54_43]|nr:MAG: hypothetical protein A2428_07225 [Bdellovibrionales bacterium RIFOXYC1_FULL_54_43]
MEPSSNFTDRFRAYFERDVAQRAAETIADGAQIEFKIQLSNGSPVESFVFTRTNRKNEVRGAGANAPQLTFILTPESAELILSDPAEEIGLIGINIFKLILSPDANRRISLKLHVGFITLFSKGYFGVLAKGGHQVASFLASKGLDGLSAIKELLKKLKT